MRYIKKIKSWWFRIKVGLTRRWIGQSMVYNSVFKDTYENTNTEPKTKNQFGSGGQDHCVMYKSWRELQQELLRVEYTRLAGHSDLTKKEYMFFSYFGSLEAYCDKVFIGEYRLYCTDHGVCLEIIDPKDMMFWELKFDTRMPTTKEITKSTQNLL